MQTLAHEHRLPVENLVTPDSLRRVLWKPPQTRVPEQLEAEVADALAALGARPWQVELTGPVVTRAVLEGDKEPEPEAGPLPKVEGETAPDEGDG